MNKAFLQNVVFLVVINLLIKPIYIFGIDRTVQNRVGEEAYGLYAALFGFSFLLQILNDFGIQTYNSREIAQNNALLDRYLSGILSLKIGLGVFYLIVVFAIAFLVGYDSAYYPMLFALAVHNILLTLVAYLRTNIVALGFYKMNTLMSSLDRFLLILLCTVLLFVEPFRSQFTIMGFIHAQNFTQALTAIICFVVVYKQTNWFKIHYDPAFFATLLRGAFPYALSIFLMIIYTKTDIVMMERLLPDGERQAGIYASAYRLLDAVNILGVLFGSLLMPMFAKQVKAEEDTTPLFRFSFQIIMVAALIVAGTVWHFRFDMMHTLYVEATDFSGEVLGVLMLSFVAICGSYIYTTLIGAAGFVSRMTLYFVSAFCLNIGLNWLLLPSYKALGGAYATVGTQFFVLFSLIFLSKKLNILRGDFSWTLRLWVFALGVFLTGYGCKIYFDNWSTGFVLAVGLSGLLALAMGFLNYRKLESILKA
jgi:O-antigen/teichoic acid export membrane protein